jgi:hypothetical protein
MVIVAILIGVGTGGVWGLIGLGGFHRTSARVPL